jgi:hypothetical protein
MGNLGQVIAVAEGLYGKPARASVTLPPLATLFFLLDQ